MKETRNYCFGSNKCSTTLRQEITGKHECRNITATRATFFRPEIIVASFLHHDIIFQSVIQSYFKTPVCGAPLL